MLKQNNLKKILNIDPQTKTFMCFIFYAPLEKDSRFTISFIAACFMTHSRVIFECQKNGQKLKNNYLNVFKRCTMLSSNALFEIDAEEWGHVNRRKPRRLLQFYLF